MEKFIDGNEEQSNPKVTFIIGNGFDLGLNMKTSYEDVYKSYIRFPYGSDVIRNFKSVLSKRKPFDKWSDFEMGMADYAKSLSSEDELIECVRDFKSHMVKHLNDENQRIAELIKDDSYSSNLLEELNRSFNEFYNCFSPNVIEELKRLLSGSYVSKNIITFNYTNVIEELFKLKLHVQRIIENPPLHIHGSLDRDVVVGIDNINQLKEIKYNLSRRGERAFIKPYFNNQYDQVRVIKAKEMIEESTVICTYGFSLGDSDKMWVDLLSDWLWCDPNHHLIIYQYDETEYSYYNFDEIMDIEELKKEELINKLGLNENVMLNQVHIPIGYDIFNFGFTKIQGASVPKQAFNVFDLHRE